MHCGMFTPMGTDTVGALKRLATELDMTDEERLVIFRDAERKGGGAGVVAIRCMMAERARIFAQLEAVLDAAQTPAKERPNESTIERVRWEIEAMHKAGHEMEDERDEARARAVKLEELGETLAVALSGRLPRSPAERNALRAWERRNETDG